MVNANLSNLELLGFDASQNHPSISLNDNASTNGIDQSFKDNPMCLEGNLLDNVMKRLDVLSSEFQKYRSETTIVMNELVDACEIRNDQMRDNHLAQKNDSLKKENKALKSDLQKLESLLTETSSKLSVAKNEKASLVAVIRLLNEDCANVVSVVGKNDRSKSEQPKNPWCTVHRRSGNQIARDAVSLNNQYSCLTIEDDDESEANVSAEQQSVGHQEVLNIVSLHETYMKPTLELKPDEIILHVGTNE